MRLSIFSQTVKSVKHVFGASLIMASMLLIVGAPVHAQVSVNDSVCEGLSAAGADCGGSTPSGDEIKPAVQKIIDILSIVVGAVSVIMIIVGGFRYVISNGDSNGLTGAKNTILYAIVGLVVVIFAQVIVRFVYSTVTDTSTTSSSSGSTGASAPSSEDQ